VTYGPQKPALFALPHLEKLRADCASDLTDRPPARIIATGIRPPFKTLDGDDDPPWLALCELFKRLPCRKEYWSGDAEQAAQMSTFGFEHHEGWLDALIETIEKER
jgi:hypothetical protein